MFHFLLRTIPRPILIQLSLWFRHIAPILYFGNRYEDPISGKTYRKFLPYGYSGKAKRKNALCPGSLSLERHRLLWLFLKRKTDFFTATKIQLLHVAPEQCFYPLFRKQNNLKYITADLNSPLADVKMDLHHTPFSDNEFDVIFCNHVLEHVDDDLQCMRELFRILKKGGWGIFQVPMDVNRKDTYEDKSIVSEADREKHFWQKDHVRLYGLDYPTRLQYAGFKVETIDMTQELGAELVDRYRLPAGEMIYLCKKEN